MLIVRGCSFNIVSSYFFHPSKVFSMLHHGSVRESSEWNKETWRNPEPSPYLTYYLITYYFSKWTLCLYHDFYGWFKAYLLHEEVMSFRLYGKEMSMTFFSYYFLLVRSSHRRCSVQVAPKNLGFIKSTYHRPNDHQPFTHRLTDHRPNNQRPNRHDSIS